MKQENDASQNGTFPSLSHYSIGNGLPMRDEMLPHHFREVLFRLGPFSMRPSHHQTTLHYESNPGNLYPPMESFLVNNDPDKIAAIKRDMASIKETWAKASKRHVFYIDSLAEIDLSVTRHGERKTGFPSYMQAMRQNDPTMVMVDKLLSVDTDRVRAGKMTMQFGKKRQSAACEMALRVYDNEADLLNNNSFWGDVNQLTRWAGNFTRTLGGGKSELTRALFKYELEKVKKVFRYE